MLSCEVSSNAGVALLNFSRMSQVSSLGRLTKSNVTNRQNNYFGFDGLLTMENRLSLIRQPTRGAMIAGLIGSLGSAMESSYVPRLARAIRREPRKSVLFHSVHGRRL